MAQDSAPDDGGHETPKRVPLESMSPGGDHTLPVIVKANPPHDTAMQYTVESHETELSVSPLTMLCGADHALPLKVKTLPTPSTATQKLFDTQETENRWWLESML